MLGGRKKGAQDSFVKLVVEIMSDGGNQIKKAVFPLTEKCGLFSHGRKCYSQVLNVTLVRYQGFARGREIQAE